MKIRIISALVAMLILIPAIIFSGTALFPILAALLALIASYEMCAAVGAKRKWQYLIPCAVYAAALPLLPLIDLNAPMLTVSIAALASVAFILIVFAVTVFCGGKENYSTAAQIALGVVYVTAGFASIVLLRRMEGGVYLYGLVFIGAWITDTMAYFTGFFLGKHKLCPAISPKKTIEGSIGGTVFCALSFLLYGFIMERACGLAPNYIMLAAGGLLISVVSQIGDLAASLIKREHGVKDFGNIMPGHGGVLDRFDSVVATALMLLILCSLPAPFVFFY